MKITLPQKKDALKCKENTFYLIQDELSYFRCNRHHIFCAKENTFVEYNEEFYKNDNKIEVSVEIDYKIPKKYKSISKKISSEYNDIEDMKNANISGIYVGISILNNSKKLFIVNSASSDVLMIFDNKLSLIPLETLQFAFDLFLIADDVDDYPSTFEIKVA